MADERVAEVLLRFKVAQDTLKAARQGFADLTKDSERFRNQTLTAAEAQRKVNEELAKLNRASAIDKIGSDFKRAATDTESWDAALKDVNKSLAAIGATDDEIAKVTREINAQAAALKAAAAAGDDAANSGGGSKLKTFGRELKALPAVQIPGLGISTDAIGKISQLLGTLPPVALQLSGALVVAGTAMAILVANTQKLKEAAQGELDARARVIGLIQTATTEELNARIKELETKKRVNEAIANDAQSVLDQLRAAARAQYGNFRATIGEIDALIGTANPELIAAKENAQKSAAALNENNTELELLRQAAAAGATAQNDYAAAIEKTNESVRKAHEDAVLAAGRDAGDFARLITKTSQLSGDAARQRLTDIGQERTAIQAELDVLNAGGNIYDPRRADRIEELNKQLNNLATESTLVTSALQGPIAAMEAQAALAKQLEALAKATEKYNSDIAAIEQRFHEQRAAAYEKYNQKLVDLATKAREAAENALRKLQERQNALALDFSRGEEDARRKAEFERLKDQIEFQRKEADAARKHERDLKRIKDDAAAAEFDAVLNRDFIALGNIRRDTSRKLEDANQQYAEDRQQRIEAFQQQAEDAARQAEYDRQTRLINYARQLADAQDQYNREYQQIVVQRQRDLQLAAQAYRTEQQQLQTKYNNEIAARRAAAVAELQMIVQTETQRVQIMAQAQTALVNQAKALLAAASAAQNVSGVSGGGKTSYAVATKAFGGPLAAGQPSFVNDRFAGQRESFNGSKFPPGLGLFIPAVSGNVNPGSAQKGGGVTFNQTNNINGSGLNEQAILRKVDQRTEALLVEYLG